MSTAQSPENSESDSGIEKPLRHEDFVGPNPLVRPWLAPYLPSNCYLRDTIVVSVGMLVGTLVSWMLAKFGGNIGVVLGLSCAVATLWFFPGEAQGRYLQASVMFYKEKRKRDARVRK